MSAAAAAEPLPKVASINLCADQHVLALADPEQILTVSWLAADPEESLLAAEAQRHVLNYGTAEEILKFAPDVVLAGTYTSPFTRTMLRRLGSGFPMDSKVFRPMMTGCPLVVSRNLLRSSGSCHGSELP